jgi:hypothetical protein
MATFNTQSQISIAPTTRLGFFRRLARRYCDALMERVMYRMAPTRKI